MIKGCKNKDIIFNKLITYESNSSVKLEFSSKTFNLNDIDCFTSYITEKFFNNYTDDFKYSIEIILKESILNSFYHGNFNINSRIKENEDGFEEFYKLVSEREKDIKYNSRKVFLEIIIKNNKVILMIRDEGNGFKYSDLNIDIYKTYGRGIKLIRINSDKIYWNEKGNEIIIEKNING